MPPPVDPKPLDALGVLRIYTACPLGPKVLLLDVRPYKVFKKSHLMGAFCVRLSANGAALLDYSQSSYSAPWSSDCWWGRPVVVYGPPGLSRDHPVIAFLAREGRVASLQYHREGFEAVEASHPYLATASVKQGCIKHYPSIIIDRELYLGDWADAEATERLQELGIKRIVTIHNHPENLRPPPGVRHLKLELPDVEGADISQHFNPSYEFIDEGRRTRQPTLVHCGAGVSRSAALVASYLMRARTWSAQRAVDHVKGARSMVQPNDGFWRVLCALEEGLGVPPQERSDPNATTGFAGADVPVQLAKDAAGEKVGVVVLGAGGQQPQHQQQQQQQQRGGEGRRDDRPRGSRRSRSRSRDRDEDRRHQDGGRGRRSRSRSRSRDRYRRRSRSRDRDRGGDRDRAERDRNRGRRSRSRSRSRDRDRRGERNGDASARPAAAAAAAAAPADPVAAAGATAAAAGKKGWLLVVGVSKPEGSVGQLILGPLGPSSRVVFGRSPAPACDVTCEHASISRQHAALSVDGATGAVSLTDLGSAHGTQLGDMWVKPQLARPVALGAPIRFGASTRCYRVERVERVA